MAPLKRKVTIMKNLYTKFRSPNDVDLWYENHKSAFPSDNDTDKAFSKAIYYYTASANTLVNRALRYDMSILEGDYMQSIFQRMIDKLPTYQIPDNIIVYRYISKGLLKAMCPSYPPKKGMIMEDKGFMSTTLIRESVNSYRDGRNQNILLVISIPIGTKGAYVGHLKSTLPEYEVILAPNTKLRIDAKCFNRCFWCTIVN